MFISILKHYFFTSLSCLPAAIFLHNFSSSRMYTMLLYECGGENAVYVQETGRSLVRVQPSQTGEFA